MSCIVTDYCFSTKVMVPLFLSSLHSASSLLSISISIYICLHIYQSFLVTYPHILHNHCYYLPVCLYTHLSVHLCLSISLSIYLYLCIYFCSCLLYLLLLSVQSPITHSQESDTILKPYWVGPEPLRTSAASSPLHHS